MKVKCADCQQTEFEQCIVRIEILKKISSIYNIILCKKCIEARLQRKLNSSDLLPIPANSKFLQESL